MPPDSIRHWSRKPQSKWRDIKTKPSGASEKTIKKSLPISKELGGSLTLMTL